MLLITNANIISPFTMKQGRVLIHDNSILAVGENILPPEGCEILDAKGQYLAPGFIDLHVHGGGGHSFYEGTVEEIVEGVNAHARYGTTTILPTTTAEPMEKVVAAASRIVSAMNRPGLKARIGGLHLEGPFLSPSQIGAQPGDGLLLPTPELVDRLLAFAPALKMMGAAPELPHAMELGDRLASRGIVASVAHSDADYDTVKEAVHHGYCDITHLYSACSTVRRINAFRVPGVVEAGLNLDEVTVQAIADGRHLPLSLLSLIYRCKGRDGMILITDGGAFAASDIPEGTILYEHGEPRLYEDGVIKLADRSAFACSVATTSRLVRTARDAGIPLCDAVRMVTENPARRVGLSDRGRIQPGYLADLVLFGEDIVPSLVMVGGKVQFPDLSC